jgi:hypothetical protein
MVFDNQGNSWFYDGYFVLEKLSNYQVNYKKTVPGDISPK